MSRIAALLADGFEDSEFTVPRDRLRAAGHQVVVLGKEPGTIEGKRGDARVEVEGRAGDASPDDFDALLLPGGWSPDHLRTDEGTVEFVRQFASTGKPLAAICHGPQLLIEADAVRGRTMTSWPSVRTDLRNAGAEWLDEEVVQDGSLITSRKPDDLDAFCSAFLEQLDAPA